LPGYKTVHNLERFTDFCPYVQLLEDGQEHTVEVYEKDLGGYFIVTVSPLRDSQGNLVGIVHIAHDITERKRVEEALAWQARVDAALAQLSAKLIAEVSIEEISALALKEAQQLTDSPSGFVGYIDPQTGYLLCPTLARDIMTGCQIQDGDIVFKSFGGLWGWVLNQRQPLLTNTPDSDPRSTGVPQGHAPISRFLSVPALVGNELVGQVALANAPRDYEDQDLAVVKRLADLFALAIQRQRTELALQAASDAAKAANRAKSEFLSSMSHELRTPLNAIIGFSEVLQDQHFGALNEKQSRQINHILSSGRHLLSLINDILDLAKVESGKMELELSPVRIAELIESSLVMIKEKALKHHLQLQEDLAPELADLTIPADERKLKQIMFNLLSNAAKFTPDGGEIKVVAMREAGDLVVSVSDTGIGIAPEDQERIFGAFEQVDSSYTRQQEGTGLGLGLTRRMVELHGGRIWVESAGKDRGSSFSFTIPIGLMAKEAALPEKSI
jgi:signal transduction histidine kinase